MPIDGINFTYPVPNFTEYRQAVQALLWQSRVDAATKEPVWVSKTYEVSGYRSKTLVHNAEWQTLKFTATEIVKTTLLNNSVQYSCRIDVTGSIHKCRKGYNYDRLYFDELAETIESLCTTLQIAPIAAKLTGLEVGVNIVPAFPVNSIINGLRGYKGKGFNRCRDNKGRYASMKGGDVVKVYDKGARERQPGYLLRFERKYCRLRGKYINGQVSSLADLQSREKVNAMQAILLDDWSHIVVYPDAATKNANLSRANKAFLKDCNTQDYWQNIYNNLSREAVRKKRMQLRVIDKNHGENVHQTIKELIAIEWAALFPEPKKADNRLTFAGLAEPKKADNRLTFAAREERSQVDVCQIKIKVTNVNPDKIEPKGPRQSPGFSRYCKTCGKPLHPLQKKGSTFCSEKYQDKKAAKKCRNTISNVAAKQRRRRPHPMLQMSLFDAA